MATTLPASTRIADLMDRERARLRERTARSGEFFARASAVMPGGVPSQFQKTDPWPTYLSHGSGASVWDVDGNQYTDFHNGFGVMCVGHANPVIAAAVKRTDGAGHALRRAHRGLDRRGRGAAPALGAARVALHQLRHRVDHGRRPSRARRDRA